MVLAAEVFSAAKCNGCWQVRQKQEEGMTEEFKIDVFKEFDKRWALLTAGSLSHYNTMTISWGGMGTMWSKPVVTVYVKPVRYTWKFLNENDYFTVSFFPDENHEDLITLGTKSGRDGDKVGMTKLKAVSCVNDTVSFEQAETVIVCKKIYWQDMKVDTLPESIVNAYYANEAPHRMYIGEVVRVIRR